MANRNRYGLVFSGGGARGAYEAGVIYYARQHLNTSAKTKRFSVYTGTSVGAINACIAASTSHDPKLQASELKRLWHDIQPGDVYARNMNSLWNLIIRSARGMTSNLIRGVASSKTHFSGLLDTRPLYERLCRDIDFDQLSANIKAGYLDACCVTATNLHSGQPELFFEKNFETTYSGDYIHHGIKLQGIHPMASAAIPIVFPAIGMMSHYYIDGGLRLNTPLSPAIQLGANRLLVIGVQHLTQDIRQPTVTGQITLGEVLSRVFNGIFLDKVRSDVDQTQRINRIIEWAEAVYGEDFLDKINQYIEDKQITGDIANRGLQSLNVLRISPSEDLGGLFREYFQELDKKDFSLLEKVLTRMLDVDPNSGHDFLSYITFSKKYLKAMFELGYSDCERLKSEVEGFLEDST